MRKQLKCFSLVLMSFFSVSVFADAVKIGVVDLQKIMQTSEQMKVIQQNLEKEFKPRRDKLVEMEKNLKGDMETFKRDNAVMSASKRKEMQQSITKAQQTFEREGRQYQQELSTAHNQAMEKLYQNIKDTIASIAKKHNYQLVLQKDAAPYSLESLDVTSLVMKELS